MANTQRMSLLRAQLIRRNIRVTDHWLEGCMEYFLEERPEITSQELLEETFDQYLLADVCEVGLPCIPENIMRVKGIQVIEGRFVAQMQYVMNVAESPFDLLQQLYKKQIDETDEEQQNRRNNKTTKKQRMLKLELTDGQTTCCAMEYSPIPQLNVKLRPGTKIRIIGPVKCINHVLFLEAKNIEVLGGEVDTLLIVNAFENMLLKALNKPINPTPKSEYTGTESTLSVQNEVQNNPVAVSNGNSSLNGMRTIDTYMTPTRTPATRPMIDDDPFEDSDILAQVDLEAITAQNTRTEVPSVTRPSTTAYHDEFQEDLDDLDALAQLEEEILAQQAAARNDFPHDITPTKNQTRSRIITSPIAGPSRSPIKYDRPDYDWGPFYRMEEDTFAQQCSRYNPLQSQSRKRPSTSPIAVSSNSFIYCESPVPDQGDVIQASKVPKLEGFDDSEDEFDLMVAAAMEDFTPPAVPVIQYHASDYKFRLEGCNLLTFDQLKQIPDSEKTNQVFMSYAQAKTVTKALAIIGDQWQMELFLEDIPDSELCVSLAPDLLVKMVGASALEVKVMRQKAKTQPEMREEIFGLLKNFNDLLKNERQFWKILFKVDETGELKPTAFSVTNLKPVYRKTLLNKIEAESLDKLRATVPD